MFSKILIANRGEIALRIIRTCKELGIKTAALCPQKGQEDNFLETKFADEFYYLNQEGILGYLDQKRIIQIAKIAKADAIHPGYGFLSENGDFADLCAKNNIKFIGPPGNILREVGNKIKARQIAKRIGLPLLPAVEKPIRDQKECLKIAKEIGCPFLLKASNGGGGIGMEVVEKIDKDKLFSIFRKLQLQVKNAFGSDEIFIEKFLQNPRHIEFQILGDGKGNVVHFGERECSIQRRYQKLVEEAPSPFLDKKLRKKMGEAAVKFGKYLKYESLGTVEFLIDKDKKFYFMEVNPRLQVEHPVTELIYRVDLVEQQIRIAQGEKLNFKQRKIKFSGWAMEFRINAEKPQENFLPTTGTVTHYLSPAGKGIEIHSFLHQGQIIFPYFDSLLAKLVIFGKNRDRVIKRAKRAFNEFIIEGLPTLIPLYKLILENNNFIEGNISTAFLKKEKVIEQLSEEKRKPATVPPEGSSEDKKEIALMVAQIYFGTQKQKILSPEVSKWKSSFWQD